MNRSTSTWLVALVLLISVGCGQVQEQATESAVDQPEQDAELSEVDIAYEEAADAYEATEDPAERVAIAKDFLSRFPDTEKTDNALARAMYPLIEDLEKPDEAYALFEEYLPQITAPEVKFEARQNLAVLHSMTGNREALSSLAKTMAAEHDFQYTDHLDLMEAAVEAEAWDLAIQQADASLALATPEAFKAQYDDISDEDAQRWGRRREAFSAAHKGWAQENLGHHEAALDTFASNAEKTTYSFLGIDDTPLHIYWGKSLILQGRFEQAMEKLEVEALYGPKEAKEAFIEAWAALHGSDEGLEEHFWSLRQKNAKPLPQFTLANYDGDTIDTADFVGDVLLVAAWNPT